MRSSNVTNIKGLEGVLPLIGLKGIWEEIEKGS
jgi:hypothetical protein